MADPNPHEETEHERIERDYVELLEEIRIALPGGEVILGFLLKRLTGRLSGSKPSCDAHAIARHATVARGRPPDNRVTLPAYRR